MHAGVTEHRRDCVSTPYTEKLLFLQKHVNTDHVSFMIFFFFFPAWNPIWIRFDEYSLSCDSFKISESPVLIHLPPANLYV